jgi:hypothetical protein
LWSVQSPNETPVGIIIATIDSQPKSQGITTPLDQITGKKFHDSGNPFELATRQRASCEAGPHPATAGNLAQGAEKGLITVPKASG